MFSNRQRLFVLLFSLILSTLIIVGGVMYRQSIERKYNLKSQTFNFGEANIGEDVKHTFIIRNPLDVPLHINNVSSSCSCTVVSDLPDVVSPGALCEVPIVTGLNIEGKKVGSTTVIQFQEHPPITLSLMGAVYRQHPRLVEFGDVSSGNKDNKDFFVRSMGDHNLVVEDLKYDERYLTATHSRTSPDSKHVLITVTLAENIPHGPFESVLEVITNNDSPKIKRIPVKGYVFKPIETEPDRLVFGLMKKDQQKSDMIKLFAPYGGDLKIDSIEVEPKDTIKVDLDKAFKTDDGISIPVSLKGGFAQKILKGTIKVNASTGKVSRKCTIDFYAMNGG